MLAQYFPENIRTRTSELVEDAISELRSNERLQLLVCGSLFIVYLLFLSFCVNMAGEAKGAFVANQSRLTLLTTQTTETGWPERAIQAEEVARQFSEQFWPGNTTGLAEAGFERWIRQSFETFGADVRQVLLTRGPVSEDASDFMASELSDVLKIRAKVIGPLSESALIQFLHEAGNHEHWVVVEQLIIRDGRNPRFEMDLATYSKTGETSR